MHPCDEARRRHLEKSASRPRSCRKRKLCIGPYQLQAFRVARASCGISTNCARASLRFRPIRCPQRADRRAVAWRQIARAAPRFAAPQSRRSRHRGSLGNRARRHRPPSAATTVVSSMALAMMVSMSKEANSIDDVMNEHPQTSRSVPEAAGLALRIERLARPITARKSCSSQLASTVDRPRWLTAAQATPTCGVVLLGDQRIPRGQRRPKLRRCRLSASS